MGIALQKAISLVVSADAELLNILRVTAQMSLKSSLIACFWVCLWEYGWG